MMNMNILAVVTPPSIYQEDSAGKMVLVENEISIINTILILCGEIFW